VIVAPNRSPHLIGLRAAIDPANYRFSTLRAAFQLHFEPCLSRTRTGLGDRRRGSSDIENRPAEIYGRNQPLRELDTAGSTPETELAAANPLKSRAFLFTVNFHARDWTAWLGREDSNLRMVESKSANPLNDFNGHSEKSVEYSLKGINRLANDSE
jgi:hypothetical protein